MRQAVIQLSCKLQLCSAPTRAVRCGAPGTGGWLGVGRRRVLAGDLNARDLTARGRRLGCHTMVAFYPSPDWAQAAKLCTAQQSTHLPFASAAQAISQPAARALQQCSMHGPSPTRLKGSRDFPS